MECQASDSEKLIKVFEASKRKKGRRKREGFDESKSVITDDSNSLAQAKSLSLRSAKASLQNVSTARGDGPPPGNRSSKRDRDSSPSVSPTPVIEVHRAQRSPRRNRRPQRDGISLALKAGLVSTPRSVSPQQEGDGNIENPDHDSLIYAFLEEAIKKDKKKHRHARRQEEQRKIRDGERERERDRNRDNEYETSAAREHRHHHRRRRDDIPSRDQEKPAKDQPLNQTIDQVRLFETFAKLCTTITEKSANIPAPITNEVVRSQSHKSLQCEVVSERNVYDVDQQPVRLRSREPSCVTVAPSHSPTRCRGRSQDNTHDSRSRLQIPLRDDRTEKYYLPLDKSHKYASKIDIAASRTRHVEDRYRSYPPPPACPTRSCTNHAYRREDYKDYRDYDDRREPIRQRRSYDEDKRRYCEHKTSRSFDIHREPYDDERLRRTSRSDSNKKRYDELREIHEKRYQDRDGRYDDRRDKYYDEKERETREHLFNHLPSKDRRSRRNLERFERTSIVSREEDYNRDRDRYSERERDSGLSVADGENSTVSGKSNYLRVVKQEISEQREAMDKMMKLWKELMRCFKGMPTNQGPGQEKVNQDTAANMQESAAAQLRLWRECMRRYETVARDVGDTDARLMEEISKQRNEMAEMATLWQECLQRYRDMSNDFNSLKRQLTNESASVPPALQQPPMPLACPETEGGTAPAPYRVPPVYQSPQMGPMGLYPSSPLRSHAAAPPAWWWCGEEPPRRRSSPESRASHTRDHRRRHKERDDVRYKEKSSKPSAGHSDHRHRKR